MRVAAGLLLIAILTAGSAAQAHSATPVDPATRLSLFKAVFAAKPKTPAPPVSSPAAPTPAALTLTPRADTAALASGAVFALPSQAAVAPDSARLLAPDLPVPGQGLAVWRSQEMVLPTSSSSGAVDSVRVTLGGVAYAPGGVVLARPGNLIGTDTQAYDVRYTRGWPAMFAASAGGYDIDFSPHAGVGMSSDGGSAEAGAMLRVGTNLQDKVMRGLDGLGMHTVTSKSLENRGRWYLFAAASGREVGLNMARDAQGNMQRLGWSAEGTSALISDAQAGVAWRKGDTQASFGYVHREIHGDFGGSANPGTVSDSMVALSLSLHSR